MCERSEENFEELNCSSTCCWPRNEREQLVVCVNKQRAQLGERILQLPSLVLGYDFCAVCSDYVLSYARAIYMLAVFCIGDVCYSIHRLAGITRRSSSESLGGSGVCAVGRVLVISMTE